MDTKTQADPVAQVLDCASVLRYSRDDMNPGTIFFIVKRILGATLTIWHSLQSAVPLLENIKRTKFITF